MQPDAKLVVLYSIITDFEVAGYDYKVVRFNTNGTIDNTFGNNGIALTDIGLYDDAQGLVLQNDGKIVVAGVTNPNPTSSVQRFILIRYNNNGSLDTSFNSTGKWIDTTIFRPKLSDIAIQSDGKIVFTGKFHDGQYHLIALRVNPNGVQDNSFGYNVISSSDLHGKIGLTNTGKILISDFTLTNNKKSITLHRLNNSGTPDNTFGTNGVKSFFYFTGNSTATDFSIVGDKILLAGNSEDGIYINNITTATLNDDGSFDTAYNDDGKAILSFGDHGTDKAHVMLQQPDGKILVGGRSNLINQGKSTIFRYNPNGTLDTSFSGGSGKLVLKDSGSTDAIALDSNGKILITQSISNMPIYRFNPDGSIDTTFGDQGSISIYGPQSFGGFAFALAVQEDNKVLVGGLNVNPENGTQYDFLISRRNSNGSLDTTFGTNGIVALPDSGKKYERISAIKLLNNGKILLIGYASNQSNTEYDTFIFRINPNGTLDTTFGSNGVFVYNSGEINITTQFAIQNDGNIVLGGYFDGNGAPALLRVTSSGFIDSSFGNNGVVPIMGVNYFDGSAPQSFYTEHKIGVTILENQKIVVNYTVKQNENYYFAMNKYNSNGAPDASFGNNGIVISPEFIPNKKLSTIGAIVTNESVFIAGDITYTNNTTDFIIAKYHLQNSMGVDDPALKNILFYPNPAIDRLVFDPSIVSATVYDMNGKQMPTLFINSEMNVSLLRTGIYIITITTQDGKKVSQKLIKK